MKMPVLALLLAALPFAAAAEPVAGIDVSVEAVPGGKIFGTGTTDAGGKAVFTDLPPGQYQMLLRKPEQIKRAIRVAVTNPKDVSDSIPAMPKGEPGAGFTVGKGKTVLLATVPQPQLGPNAPQTDTTVTVLITSDP